MRVDKKKYPEGVIIGIQKGSSLDTLWLLKILPSGKQVWVQAKLEKLQDKNFYLTALEKCLDMLEITYEKRLKEDEKNAGKN